MASADNGHHHDHEHGHEDGAPARQRELERLVRERTAQLDAAHRDLDAFSYTVAHDLRAPLRHIGQFVALTQEVLEPEGRHDLLQYQAAIATAARRMGLMIDGLLEFTRLGRAPIERVPVSLAPIYP